MTTHFPDILTGAEVEVLAPGEKTLQELAATANSEFALSVDAAVDMLSHAIACGRALLSAQERVGEEGWIAWQEDNLDFNRASANGPMRLAAFEHLLPPFLFQRHTTAGGHLHKPSPTRALIYLKGLEVSRQRGPLSGPGKRKDPLVQAECKRLKSQGLSYREIGELLGISYDTARRICNPALRKAHLESKNRRNRERMAARKALAIQREREARDLAAKQTGGALGETYSRVRKTLDEAQRARMEAAGPLERAAIDDALTHLHKAEDAIAKALKVPA